MLEQELATIKGIGDKKAQLLNKMGLFTVRDLLFRLPRDYQDFSEVTPCAALEEGERCVRVRFISEARVAFVRRGLAMVNAQAHDETGSVKLVWYNQTYRKKQIVPGQTALIFGKGTKRNGRFTFENPDIEIIEEDAPPSSQIRGIQPIYGLTAGIGQKTMRKIVQSALNACFGHIKETLPLILREAYGLCEINFALQQVHFPDNRMNLEQARRRLWMEDLFFFLLAVAWMEKRRKQEKGIAFETECCEQAFLALLPFAPTEGQRQAMQDIERDMAGERPMNRLIQGDVGSGKTILAFYAMSIAAKNGCQSVLLAPTEILARQHAKAAHDTFGETAGIECFVGGMSKRERAAICQRIASGESRMIIATHAVLQDDVVFANLGLVVTDEQHRFGVRQRAALTREQAVDVLIMSATPIPRTLTLILYGDLDVSIIKGRPPGRKPISTHFVSHRKRDDLYRYILAEAEKGHQAYIVAPLVEESDVIDVQSAQALHEELSKGILQSIPVALLHGRMDTKEKECAIQAFRDGEVKVMVATTVIEVGVDVPQATIMVIEGAERFGLAQLHQLRGRVGRGSDQSYCFLLSNSDGENALERIQTLCKSQDGFVIAQKDLELRGPGEFLGTRQSGMGEFKMGQLAANMLAFEEARNMAQEVLNNPKYEEDRRDILNQMQKIYEKKLQEIAIN